MLRKLVEDTNAIVINPETLAFNYLTNSTILQFFLEAGVKLDLFFKLLWRHVFTVELLRNRYDLKTKEDTGSFFSGINPSSPVASPNPQPKPKPSSPPTVSPGSIVQNNSGGANVLQGTTGENSPIINSPVTIGRVPKTISPQQTG